MDSLIESASKVAEIHWMTTVEKPWKHFVAIYYLVNKRKYFGTAVIRIGIVLIKTYFVTARTFDPRRRPGVSEVGLWELEPI